MENEIKVSILCAAYNHQKYIRETLERFINQKTNFKFEVIIHDDASTDKTAEIIREYEIKYPEIIKPIYQKENQYSKNGVSVTRDFLIPKAKGKYVAFCEGDDFWIDDYKLQKQFDYMEEHPDCTLCICNGINIKENSEFLSEWIIAEEERDFSTEEVILGGGGFCPTNSIFIPTILAKQLPKYYNFLGLDYTLQIYFASCGYTHLLKDKMIAYRNQSVGSWTTKHLKETKEKKAAFYERIIKMLELFNEETGKKYESSVEIAIAMYRLSKMLFLNDNSEFDKKLLKIYKENLKGKEKIKTYLFYISPKLYSCVKKLYKNINNEVEL